MGRIDFGLMRYLQPLHFRVLTAVEMGMKNHQLVPLHIVAYITAAHRGAVNRALSQLREYSAVVFEKGKRYDGYKLTQQGYGFLALNALYSRGCVGFISNKICVGKESEIFVAASPETETMVLKFHKLGRTFQRIKEKRDYLNRRRSCSWLYLARLAATREYAFLTVLHSNCFPVPRPIDHCRHTVVMEHIDGETLCNLRDVCEPSTLFDKLMSLIVCLGEHGLIHGDFNEFNIMLTEDEKPVLIDFPQMVSIDHENAEFYFDRDVQCIQKFFKKRFRYESELFPKFSDVKRRAYLDVETKASGHIKIKINRSSSECLLDRNGDRESKNESEIESEGDCESSESWKTRFKNLEIGPGHIHHPRNEKILNWIEDVNMSLEQLMLDKSSTVAFHEVDNYCDADHLWNDADDILIPHTKDKLELGVADVLVNASEDKLEDGFHAANNSASVISIESRFAPNMIRRQVTAEIRAREKKQRRMRSAKGKASGIRLLRKNNAQIIKENAGWSF